jgi:hypothetical protein
MPGLDPGIHVFAARKIVDGRDKPGHDELRVSALNPSFTIPLYGESSAET